MDLGRVGRDAVVAKPCSFYLRAERRGGYTECVRHGENGFLFDDDAEAWEQLMRLRDEPALRARIGAAARRTMEELFGSTRVEEILHFYRQ